MSTDTKRTHGAQPDKDQQKPKILMAVRTHAPIDEKTGRSIESEDARKVYVEGMEDELLDELTDDQLAYLEAGGFVQGIGIALPNETTLSLDPTVRAGAGRATGKGKDRKITLPETATISGPRSQRAASTATVVGAAEEADEEDKPRPRSGKRSGKKGSKKD